MENLYVDTGASRVKRDCTGLYGILLLKHLILEVSFIEYES